MTSETQASATVPDELLTAALTAARQARSTLGEVSGLLQQAQNAPVDTDPLAREVSEAIGALFAVEAGQPREVHQALHGAMERLRHVLAALQDVPSAPQPLQQATPSVARTLATLHPTFTELDRRLEDSPGDVQNEEPIPLQQAQQAPKLELVPDAEPEADEQGAPPERRSSVPPQAGERRRSPRVGLDVGVGFQSESNFYTGFTGDISEGGLFIATYEILPLGTEVVLSVWIPDGRQVTARGRVQWIREPMDFASDAHPGMGVRFEALSDEAREVIHRFISKREPIFHEQ